MGSNLNIIRLLNPAFIAADIAEDLPPSPSLLRDKPSRACPIRRDRV